MSRYKICEINDVAELENYIKTFDKDFNKFVDISQAETFISNTFRIGVKSFKRWYRKQMKSVRSRFVLSYWTNRGHTIENAKVLISEIQSSNSKKRHAKVAALRDNSDDSWKKQFNMNPEYYIARGHSSEDAAKIVHERQTTFSLQKCIAKYGLEKGHDVWFSRQEKWKNTLAAKSDAEKIDISRRRTIPVGRASRESLKIFEPLCRVLVGCGVCSDKDVYYGYEARNEWYLGDSENFYLYDFCVPKLKVIIEYQGKAWHPDHRLSANELVSWKNPHGISGIDIRVYDAKKKEFAERHGYKVFYVWGSDDQKTKMQAALNALIETVSTTSFTVPIKNVQSLMHNADVSVLSANGFVKVTQFHTKYGKQLYEILLSNGNRLVCSDDHYVRLSSGHWASVRDLVAAKDTSLVSLQLMTDMGPKSIIALASVGVGTVNDLTVDHPEHSYYTNGIVGHNTGKTCLCLAAALDQLNGFGTHPRYDKIIVTKPIEPVGRDLGFLPGTIEEKMDPWVAPIKDNLNFLMGDKKTKRRKKGDSSSFDEPYLALMQEKGIIEIEAITFIRGRSIPNAFMIVDEAQNLSIHELKTIITRVGEGTKIVLSGDFCQIDNLRLDVYTNGLTYAVEKFKEHAIAGHITLLKGERSELATLAAKIL